MPPLKKGASGLSCSAVAEKPLRALDIPDEFIRQSEKMGYSTLKDITGEGWGKLSKNQYYTAHWFCQLLDILEQYHLSHLIKKKS